MRPAALQRGAQGRARRRRRFAFVRAALRGFRGAARATLRRGLRPRRGCILHAALNALLRPALFIPYPRIQVEFGLGHSLKAPGFKFCFQIRRIAPLHRGGLMMAVVGFKLMEWWGCTSRSAVDPQAFESARFPTLEPIK
jgi:hypothetical protein